MACNENDDIVDRCGGAAWQWDLQRQRSQWHPPAAARKVVVEMVHDNDKKCIASPATVYKEDNDLIDRDDNKGNGGGVDNDNDVLVGAGRNWWAHGVTWRRQGRHRPWRASVRPYDGRRKPDKIGPARKPVGRGSERSGWGFKFKIWNPRRRTAVGDLKLFSLPVASVSKVPLPALDRPKIQQMN